MPAGVGARVLRGESFAAMLTAFPGASFDADPDDRQAMIDDPPLGLSDARSDALLGAVAEHLALTWSLEVQDWTRETNRFPAGEHVQSKRRSRDSRLARCPCGIYRGHTSGRGLNENRVQEAQKS